MDFIRQLVKLLIDMLNLFFFPDGIDESGKSKKEELDNLEDDSADGQRYLSRQFINGTIPPHATMFRQRHSDSAAANNSQSSFVPGKLPRPFHAAKKNVYQSSIRNIESEVNGGSSSNHFQISQSNVVSDESWNAVNKPPVPPPPICPPQETFAHNSNLDNYQDNTIFSKQNNKNNDIGTGNTEMDTIATKSWGLRGSRPLVKMDRLTLLSQQRQQMLDDSKIGSAVPSESSHLQSSTSTSQNGSYVQKINFPQFKFSDLALKNVIGGGGFGQVWKADWQGTPVAVKILSHSCQHSQLPEQLLLAFEEEVNILAQLRHPNVCLFLGVSLEPANRAIVTELVSRGSLWDALRVPGLMEPQQAQNSTTGIDVNKPHWPLWAIKRVLEGTCRGLVYLHSHQPPIIHRDLKSANLLLDESFNVKICDFGLARLRDYTTVLTANVGTIQWMAPEVLTGSVYGESADIFSVGVVLWEMFTGKCPYEGMQQIEIAISVVHNNLRPTVPLFCTSSQKALIQKCWAQDQSNRYRAEQLLKSISLAF